MMHACCQVLDILSGVLFWDLLISWLLFLRHHWDRWNRSTGLIRRLWHLTKRIDYHFHSSRKRLPARAFPSF